MTEKILFIDTETTREMPNQIFYDFGWAVTDRQGVIYECGSLVNSDVFYKRANEMKSAYYADKIPQYNVDIWDKKRIVKNTYEIKELVKNVCEKWNVKYICAYNTHFDKRACDNTQKEVTENKYKYFLPYGIELWDAWKMAQDTICKQKGYIKFCEENGYMTKHKTPRPQTKAEVVYKYITKDTEFVESHTGLEDVMIEIAIMKKCFSLHKKMRCALYTKKSENVVVDN